MMIPLAVMALALVTALLGRAPLFLALCVGASLFIQTVSVLSRESTLLAHRSFYGRYAVLDVRREGDYHALYHGSTLHGAQGMRLDQRREPLTYYARTGPLGQIFTATAEKAGRRRV